MAVKINCKSKTKDNVRNLAITILTSSHIYASVVDKSVPNNNKGDWKMKKSFGSFTLIELITVFAIICLLAGILFPALNAAREKARAARKTPVGAKEMIVDSGKNGESEKVLKIENVVRVFMHQPKEYTYFYSIGQSNEIAIVTIQSKNLPRIFVDVPSNKTIWVRFMGYDGPSCQSQEIHLQSVENISGAGWEKRLDDQTTKGNTGVVQ